MSNILLVNSTVAFEQRVRRSFKGSIEAPVSRWDSGAVDGNPYAAVKEMMEESPSVVAIGPNVELEVALELAWTFQSLHPEVETILVAEPDEKLWRNALRSGATDVVRPDAPYDEIREIFEHVQQTATRRRLNLIQEVDGGGGGARVITVVAPKGGSGKTALSTNLAVSLAATGDQRVVLVDLDLQFGDVADALQLRPEHTIADLKQSAGGLTQTNLKAVLTSRGENLFVLCAPLNPAEGELVTSGEIEEVLRILKAEFDVVVVDTPAGITEQTLTSVELSSDLMLICDLSASSVRGLQKVVEALDRLEITGPKRHFILNRADSRVGVTVDDASAVVGMPVSVAIPSARDVPLSMNQGIPVIEAAPKTMVARRFRSTAHLFNGQDGPTNSNGSATSKRGILARLKGDYETQ